LQTIKQLDVRYGRDYAQSIQGGFNTYLAYSGSDQETCRFFESIIGRTRVRELPDNLKSYNEHYREENLINANEVRTMPDDHVLIVSSNRNPIMTNTTPYYKQGRLLSHLHS